MWYSFEIASGRVWNLHFSQSGNRFIIKEKDGNERIDIDNGDSHMLQFFDCARTISIVGWNTHRGV
jgi:hypothetical protein